MKNEEITPQSLEDILRQKLDSSHSSRKVVRTPDGRVLFDKSDVERFESGQRVEDGSKILVHLSCAHEFRGQATVRSPENPDLIYCERCFSRCFSCKKPLLISRSYPRAGHIYCRRHYWLTSIGSTCRWVAGAFAHLLSWLGRHG